GVGRLAKYRALAGDERRVVRAAILGLGAARLLLRGVSLQRVRRTVSRIAPASAVSVERLAHLVSAAAAGLPGATTCLPRAIVLEALLKASGRPAELRIGVAPRGGLPRLRAHAWVELEGAAVGDDPSEYAALPVFGTEA